MTLPPTSPHSTRRGQTPLDHTHTRRREILACGRTFPRDDRRRARNNHFAELFRLTRIGHRGLPSLRPRPAPPVLSISSNVYLPSAAPVECDLPLRCLRRDVRHAFFVAELTSGQLVNCVDGIRWLRVTKCTTRCRLRFVSSIRPIRSVLRA